MRFPRRIKVSWRNVRSRRSVFGLLLELHG
jgi:hypothetical protein